MSAARATLHKIDATTISATEGSTAFSTPDPTTPRNGVPGRTRHLVVFLLLLVAMVSRPFVAMAVPHEPDVASLTSSDSTERGGGSAWMEQSTEHVRFIFRRVDLREAEFLLSIAESAYTEVTEFFGSYPEEVVCVIRSDTVFANGHFSPLPPHIEVITTAPSGPLIGAATESWIEAVFIHELAHFVHLTSLEGILGSFGRLFGPAVASLTAAFLPGWMLEGPAVYLETALTNGGRGRNPFFEMHARALILEDELFTLRQAAHSSRFPPPGRIYLTGYLIIDYLVRNHGEDAMRRIADKFVRFPFFGPWRAIEEIAGIEARDLYRRLTDELRTIYEAVPSFHTGSRVTPNRYGNYYLPIRTERGWLLYRDDPRQPSGIVRFNPETGEAKEVVSATLIDPYSFSSDFAGKLIVFASPTASSSRDYSVVSDLFRVEHGGARVVRLTQDEPLRHPVLSADGKRLFAIRQEAGFASLVEVDLTTGSQSLLLRMTETNLYTPIVREESGTVVFVSNRSGRQELSSIRIDAPTVPLALDTGATWNEELVVHMTDTDEAEYHPQETPLGIVYGSDAGGRLGLYLLDEEKGGALQIVSDPVGAFAGFIDEKSIVYASYSHTGYVIKRTGIGRGSGEILRRLETMAATAHRAEGSVGGSGADADPQATTSTDGGRSEADFSNGTAGGADSDASNVAGGEGQRSSANNSVTRDSASPPVSRASEAYRDLPRLAFWYPTPFANDPTASQSLLDRPAFGPGAHFYLRSPVHGHELALGVALRPDRWQPMIDLGIVVSPPRNEIDFRFIHGYRENGDGSAVESLTVSIQHLRAIAVRTRGQVTSALTAGWTARYAMTLRNSGGFTPFAGLGALAGNTPDDAPTAGESAMLHHVLVLSPLFVARVSRRAAASAAANAPAAIVTSRTDFLVVRPFPLYPRLRSRIALAGVVPIARSGHLVGAELEVGMRDAADRIPAGSPGGGFAPNIGDRLGDVLLGISYHTPVVPLDLALPLGLHVASIRGELDVHGYGSFVPGFQIHRDLFVGARLVAEVGKTAHLPFGVGVAARVPFDRAFTPLDDIRIYVVRTPILGALSSK